MKFTAMTLSAAVLAALMAISPGTAEAKSHRHKHKHKKVHTHLALTPSMHLSIHRIQTPDLDDFPPTAAHARDVPVVGSEEAIRATGGVMSTSLATPPVASAAPPAPVWSAGRLVVPSAAALQVASVQASGEVLVSKLTPPARAPAMEAASHEVLNRFDLVVNNAPASQVFLQLGSSGSYNVLVPPDVSGSISISLKNTTVLEALEALRELFGYDFKVSGNRVFVYPNTVQTRLFKINYLPGRRQGVSDIRVSSSSIVQQSGGTGSSGSTGTSNGATSSGGKTQSATALEMSSINMTSDTDFWRDVKDSLNNLLAVNKGSSVTLNPGAGVIVVRATPAELRQVADYLKAVQITIERQVMLEAKIVEVQLGDATQTGVNWSLFGGIKSGGNKFGAVGVAPGVGLSNNGTLSTGGATINPGSSVVAEALGKGFYGLAVQGTNFTALLSFLETQGNVQVLSSPRIATINNQKAVLKVGTDELFLTNVTNNSTSTASGTTNSPSLTLQPFFSGISLDVTPQIDDKGVVMLHVHPSISVVSEKQKTFDLGGSQVLRLPLATSSINETDSIVRVMDGQIVAIGGLMQASGSKETSGLPGVSDVPVVGNAFKYKQTSSYKRELVILIKPTVISDMGQGFSDAQPATPLIHP
jgi:MSHA biogenesis protein MshL